MEPASQQLYQFLHYSLTDTEKVYSGLTDGCAKAGRTGCKLIEITGDNATGEDVKALVNYALDVSGSPPRLDDQTNRLCFHHSWPSNSIVMDMKFPLPPAT